jgi:hypothetical protein
LPKLEFCVKLVLTGGEKMTVIVCVSDDGGMLFNKRRQSRDKILIKNLGEIVGDGILFVSDFSLQLFNDSDISIIAVSNPLESAGAGDFAFVEDKSLREYMGKTEGLIIYRWNRAYPSDFWLDVNPSAEGMVLSESMDFVGKAHEKITRECWKRV